MTCEDGLSRYTMVLTVSDTTATIGLKNSLIPARWLGNGNCASDREQLPSCITRMVGIVASLSLPLGSGIGMNATSGSDRDGPTRLSPAHQNSQIL